MTPDEKLAELRAQTDERNVREAELLAARRQRKLEAKQRYRDKKRQEKKAAQQVAQATALAVLGPTKPAPPKPAPPVPAKRKHVREALEKVLIQARAYKSDDPTVKNRLEAILLKVYQRAMADDTELKDLLEAAKFISERLEGKPTQEIVSDEGEKQQTFNIIVSPRFASPEEKKQEAFAGEVVVNPG